MHPLTTLYVIINPSSHLQLPHWETSPLFAEFYLVLAGAVREGSGTVGRRAPALMWEEGDLREEQGQPGCPEQG